MANEQMCCGHTSPVDRISDLPDGILHHILSYLPTKVVAQTSVLSKRWQYLWDSYPIFDFCQHYFYIPGHKIDVERVTDVVDRKLKSFCKYEFEIQKFRLSLSLIKPKYASLVEKWMVLVKEKHVKELELALHTARPGSYNLPREIFVAKSLTALQICVDEGHDILLPSSIKLHSLVRLCLTGLHIDEMIFDDHKFPCIEFIQFSSCIIQGGLKVSCLQLKKLLLIHCEQFCKIEISAPNLSSMSYFGGLMPTSLLLSLNLPFKLKKFKLSSGSHCRLNTSWYIKLKESLLQMQNGTETLVLFIDSIKKNKFDSIGASKSCRSPPYSLKCLVLNLYLPRIFDFEALIDGFLSIFHPEILSVIFKVAGAKCCLEILFKTIEGREDQSCCSSSKIKCWRHSFKVKQIIVKKFKGIKEKIPLTWDAFSKAMCEETYKVDFYLTW